MGFVIDASCALKLVLDDAGGPAYREWFRQALEANTSLISTTLLVYEVGNVVARRLPALRPDEQAEAARRIVHRLRLVEPEPASVFPLMAHGLMYYDASYLAVAHAFGETLVTADQALAAAAEQTGVAVRRF